MIRSRANKLLLVPCLALCLLASCADKQRGDVLSPAKLETVLYDYHLAQVVVSDLPSNQRYKKDLYFDYIYDKHGVTKAEIDSSLVYYARHPKELSEVYVRLYERVSADIKRLADEEKPLKQREATAVVGDSADLWYDFPVVQMTSSPLASNRYAFTIPTDTNFRRADRLVWSGKALFLQGGVDSLRRYLHLDLKVKYMNDSIASADTLLYTSGDFTLVVTDTAVVKSIHGSAYLKSSDADERLLIFTPSLMRYRDRADSLVTDTASLARQMDAMRHPKSLMSSSKLTPQ